MRKVYNLLLLAALFVTSTFAVQAQLVQRYGIADRTAGMTSDQFSEGVKFVMESAVAADQNEPDFINGLNKKTYITDDDFYEVEIAGQDDSGNVIWRLKRCSTNEYLENNGGSMSYTTSATRAWKFYIKDATTVTAAELDDTDVLLKDYAAVTRDSTTVTRVIFSDASGDPSKKGGSTFFLTGDNGKAPSFGTNYLQNAICAFFYEEGNDDSSLTKMGAYECLQAELDELLPNGLENKYIVGEQPGQTPQQYYDAAVAANEACTKLINAMSEDMDACNAALEALKKALNDCDENYIRVEEGFYFFSSGRSDDNGVYDGDNLMLWTYGQDWTVPTAPGKERAMTMDDVKYVWQIIADPANPGAYFLQNYYTKGYIGIAHARNTKIPTISEPTESFLIYSVGTRGSETTWSIESTWLKAHKNDADAPTVYPGDGNDPVTALHCASDYNAVVLWTPGNNGGSGWRFYKVNMDELKAFDAQIEQSKLNGKLTDLYNTANAAYEAGAYCLDFNGNKSGELDTNEDGTPMGLLTSVDQLSSNSIETTQGEGNISDLLDSNLASGNFFHSIWNSSTAEAAGFDVNTMYPDLVMDLRKAVSDVMIKFWPRRNGSNVMTSNLPGKVSIQASNDGENWTQIDTLNTALTYKYIFTEGNVTTNNQVATLRIKLPEAYQWIRMQVCTRYGSDQDFVKDIHKLSNSCWNAGEMRVFECWDNPEIALNTAVDATVLKNLEDALAAAKTEVEAESATQATYDNLSASYEAYQNELPDPSQVTAALTEAKAQLNAAEEGEEYGYFETGAKDALQAKLDAVSNKVTTVMTKAVISSLKEEIANALADFNTKLVLPKNGAYVYMVSGSSEKPNGGHLRTGGNNAVRNQWATLDADENLQTRLDYVWKVVRNDDNTFQLQNVLNGQYLNAPKANNLGAGMSAEADTCKFTFRTAKVAGFVNVVFADGVYMNAQPNGSNPSGNVVTWNSASGTDNSAWQIVDADMESNWDGTVIKDVAAQRAYIFTLPISVKANNCYEVLGRNGNNIELKKIEGNIEGGTPFIYFTDEDETTLYFDAVESDPTNLTYATEAKTVNGLCGTFAPVNQVPVGYGIIYNSGTDYAVVDAAKGDAVATNSGYFTPAIPETAETGDARITIDGKIDAIGNTVVNNALNVNVYTLSGVKVRSNVKAENATKSLPAGLYIVGGKKVIVK